MWTSRDTWSDGLKEFMDKWQQIMKKGVFDTNNTKINIMIYYLNNL